MAGYILKIVLLVLIGAFSVSGARGPATFKFNSPANNVTETVGSDVIFYCFLDQQLGDEYNMIWKKGNDVLSMNQIKNTRNKDIRIFPRENSDGFDLEVRNLGFDDEGRYSCEVNSVPPIVQHHQLMVYELAKIQIPEHQLFKTVDAGSTLVLRCPTTGRPKPAVIWTRAGKKLPNGQERYAGEELVIDRIDKDGGGEYECAASNMNSHWAREIVEVNVQYPPSVSSMEQVVYSGKGKKATLQCVVIASPKANVQWTRNGFPVGELRNYRQRYQPDGMKDVHSLQITTLGMDDFGFYKCLVSNDKGSSSETIQLVGTPSPVQILSESKGRYSRIYSLKWKVISKNNLLDNQYMIRSVIKLENGTLVYSKWTNSSIPPDPSQTGSNHDGSYKLTGLKPLTQYQLRMRAKNDMGFGEWSETFHFQTAEVDSDYVIGDKTSARDGQNGRASTLNLSASLLLLIILTTFKINY